MIRLETRTVAIVGLIFISGILLAILILGMYTYAFLLLLGDIGIALFVITDTRRRMVRHRSSVCSDMGTGPNVRKISRILPILFFLFYALSILVISPGSSVKPVSYYLLISLCAGAVAADVLVSGRKVNVPLNLVMSLLLSLNVFLVNQLIFSNGIGGSDSPTHLRALVYPIIETGFVPSQGFSYSDFPLHHIFVATGSLILSTEATVAYFGLLPLLMVSGVPLAYLIGRRLFDRQFGLLAALLFSGNGYLVYWASHSDKMTFVMPQVILLLLLILCLYRKRSMQLKILIPILSISIILSHPYSSMLILVILSSILIAEKLFALRKSRSHWTVSIVLLTFLCILIAHWTYSYFQLHNVVGIGERYLATIMSDRLSAPPSTYDSYPLELILLNTFGAGLVLMMAVCGFLLLWSKPRLEGRILAGYTAGVGALMSIGVGTNFIYVLPNRIYAYLEALSLVFLAVAGIRYFQTSLGRKSTSAIRSLMLVLVVILIFSFSLSSTISGFETSLFVGDQPYKKLYETEYEKQSVSWIGEHLSASDSNEIYRSWSFSIHSTNRLLRKPDFSSINVTAIPLTAMYEVDIGNVSNGSMILFSRFDIDIGFEAGQRVSGRFGQGIYVRFDEEILTHFLECGRYYDNGKIIGFKKPR